MSRTGQVLRRRTAQKIGQRSTPVGATSHHTAGLSARLRYYFDNTMSRGTPALVAWLFAATVVLVLFFAVLEIVFGLRSDGIGFWPETFQGLMHALDPGTVAGDQGSWRFLITMLVLTIAGLFITSALIGVIAAGIDARLADLRRGRSVVLETDHTVLLGWSDSIFTVINELTIANESRRRPVIAVLADGDKVELEEQIRAKIPRLRGSRIVVRSGSPSDPDDLMMVSPQTARSIVVLSSDAPGGAADEPDRMVIKTLLALRSMDLDAAGPRIVAQLREPANLEVARMIGRDRPGRLSLIDIRGTGAKLLVQTARQSGAAAVYRELFDYDGDEIYFLAAHAFQQSTYRDALLAFETVSVIGVAEGDQIWLNPAPDTLIGDRALVVVAEDDSILGSAAPSSATVAEAVIVDRPAEQPQPSHVVLLGWNERAPLIVQELDRYAGPGSTLTAVVGYGNPRLASTERMHIEVVQASTTDRGVLEEHLGGERAVDQVVVLGYSDELDAESADATTLITLLHVRDILARSSRAVLVVSEMMDDRNRALAAVADIDDVVVSGELVSLLMTQVAEDARIEPVFQDLLSAEGSEVYLRPAEWYVEAGRDVNWATVVAAASRRGESAIGFSSRRLADPGSRIGVVVNPPKSETFAVEPGDRVIVLSES